MDIIKAMLLGLIQGLSEFLPISSSGHLVIFSDLLGFQEEGVAFEVFVHFGTLLSVLLAFRKELREMVLAPFKFIANRDTYQRSLLFYDLYIIGATIPAAFIGLVFKDQIEALFSSSLMVFVFLFVTGVIMWLAPFFRNRKTPFNFSRTFLIGIAQAAAILPGISRSGSTIFTGIAMGMDRERVAKFSFLLSIPAIFGAVVLKVNDLLAMPPDSEATINLIAGTVMAFISGYIAIILLLDVVKKGKLQWFGYYCMIVALSGIVWYIFF